MSYTLKTNLSHPKNYGGKRNKSVIKYIVIHYTGNDGDTDENNGKYFHNNRVGASAHIFVDSDSATLSVPLDHVAYAVGGNYGGGRLYRQCTNINSISIELCDDIKNGKVYPHDRTIENALSLVNKLMREYNIPKDNVIRHYDVNGKKCPAYWVDDTKWKKEFWNKIDSTTTTKKPYRGKFPIIPPTLKLKSVGGEVKKLQKYLNWYNNYKLTVDGDFGNNTLKAVKNFQNREKLTVDGMFGVKSLNKAKGVKK